jgi:pSer/pThr/pTyr-binding forkhead associated (FHA) protein
VLADVAREGPTVEAPPVVAMAPELELAAPEPAPPEPSPPEPAPPPAPVSDGGIRAEGTETRAFRRPAPAAARAVLRVTERDGRERVVEVDGSPLTVGRATDNALVIADGRVSRHHGRLQARRGMLVYTDLGSTNGSRVNGIRVDEIVLGPGDRLMLGDVMLVVESLPG